MFKSLLDAIDSDISPKILKKGKHIANKISKWRK